MESSEWDLVMTRVFDAPRELVFKAWTDTKHVGELLDSISGATQ